MRTIEDKIRVKQLEISTEKDQSQKAKLQLQLRKLLLKKQEKDLNDSTN